MANTTAEAALAELSQGQPGPMTVALLQRLGRQCTRSARTTFPPPEGYTRWSDDAVDHLLADMFDRKDRDDPGQGHKFLLNCYLRATDGPSLERLLLVTIQNFLKDQAKGTTRGQLRRRLQSLFEADERFRPAMKDRWRLADGPAVPWQGDRMTLERAALNVRGVEITQWNHAGPTPRATREALLTVAQAGLEAAQGSVHIEDLARIVQQRFRLLREPNVAPFDDQHDHSGPDEEVDVNVRARELFALLSPQERRLVPVLGQRSRWKDAVGAGRAQARVIGEALIEQLRLATVDEADHDRVVLALVELCGGFDDRS
ncbi:hypothetical protein [Planobispora rosea]|uniref:hypothetical protein n=1 Tax=Planobispora rosea TaxID=35762 RepID=UPI001C3FFC39|nr:hypothetical protein [Planobispora rosea]